MLDRLPPPQLQRARGRAEVGFSLKNNQTALRHLHQAGCLKAMLPNTHGGVPEVVLVNTAGGIAGGDQLAIAADLEEDTKANFTTQTAERVYRSSGGTGHIDVRLRVGRGAALKWLPQETILFDGAKLKRNLEVDLTGDGQILLLESFMLGRKAMGEHVADCAIKDRWHVRRDGRLIFAEALRIDDARTLAGPAALNKNLAFATMLWATPDAHLHLDRLRALLKNTHIRCAASAWEGVLVSRFIAPDAYTLRCALTPIIESFTKSALPRVWQL